MLGHLISSNALSARLDPEEMRELLRGYQGAVAAEIERADGRIAKFLGGGVLAYFGSPRAGEDDAERAVRAGLAAVAATAALRAAGGEALAARVGIATGAGGGGEVIGGGGGGGGGGARGGGRRARPPPPPPPPPGPGRARDGGDRRAHPPARGRPV